MELADGTASADRVEPTDAANREDGTDCTDTADLADLADTTEPAASADRADRVNCADFAAVGDRAASAIATNLAHSADTPYRPATMNPPTIVTVLQCKGGVGKTTVATNLAACAHLAGLRTLLLDLEDPRHRGLSSMWFALRAPESPLRDLVTHVAAETWTPTHFLSVAAGYDLVVCDAPASLARATLPAAVVANLAIVPMLVGPAEIFALDPVGELVADANRQRARVGAPELPWACVLNRVAFGTKENQAMAEQLAARVELLPAVLGDRLAYRRAIAAGECVLTHRPRDVAAAQEGWGLFTEVLARTPLAGRKLRTPEGIATKRGAKKAA